MVVVIAQTINLKDAKIQEVIDKHRHEHHVQA
jgi:hypothetical protein